MILRFVFLGLLAPLCVSDLGFAATLHVPADYLTIQSCIDAAVSGQDECVVAPGTYHELVNFLGKAITLRSISGPYNTTIDGTGLNGSVVTFNSDQDVEATIEGFTITGGVGTKPYAYSLGGGVYIRGDVYDQHQVRFELKNVAVTGNDAEYGGGVFVASEDTLILSSCEIIHNTAKYGGAVFGNSYAKIHVQNASLWNNSAEFDGGAICGERITLDVTNSSFYLNSAGVNGGALAIENSLSSFMDYPSIGSFRVAQRHPTYVSISNSIFALNVANGQPANIYDRVGGGAIFAEADSFDILGSTFENNAASMGGAILDGYFSAQIANCAFSENQSDQDGGALYNFGSVDSTSFLRNRAGRDGEGIFGFPFQAPPVSNCSFSENSARRGGGIFGWVDVTDGTFTANIASDSGGAWYGAGAIGGVFLANEAGLAGGAVYLDGPTRLLDSLFVGNTATVGGAVYNGGSASIYNATFVENHAADSGGAISNLGGKITGTYLSISSAILWNNFASMHSQIWIDEKAYNTSIVASDIEGSGGSGNWDASLGIDLGNNLDLNPAFGRLSTDGGDGWGDDPSTPNYYENLNDDFGDLRLMPDSPCINAGDPNFLPPSSATDVAGHPRVLCGRVDMGAYEFGTGDFDCDQNVNLRDVAAFQTCFGGQTTAGTPDDCKAFDFDVEQDVDVDDWATFQLTYQGVSRHCDATQDECTVFTLIDFEGVPAPPSLPRGSVKESYADWGVIFHSIGARNAPSFQFDSYGNPGGYAASFSTTYPPGFNMIADFYRPVFAVSSDVMCAAGYTVTMTAKDSEGNILSSVTSPPAPPTFWSGPIFLNSETPIASVEWWPSIPNSGVGIDNLQFWSR